jgi:hypothetical protein
MPAAWVPGGRIRAQSSPTAGVAELPCLVRSDDPVQATRRSSSLVVELQVQAQVQADERLLAKLDLASSKISASVNAASFVSRSQQCTTAAAAAAAAVLLLPLHILSTVHSHSHSLCSSHHTNPCCQRPCPGCLYLVPSYPVQSCPSSLSCLSSTAMLLLLSLGPSAPLPISCCSRRRACLALPCPALPCHAMPVHPAPSACPVRH